MLQKASIVGLAVEIIWPKVASDSSFFKVLITTFESPSMMIDEKPSLAAKDIAWTAASASTSSVEGGSEIFLDKEASTWLWWFQITTPNPTISFSKYYPLKFALWFVSGGRLPSDLLTPCSR